MPTLLAADANIGRAKPVKVSKLPTEPAAPAPLGESSVDKPKRQLTEETKAKLAAARQRKKEEKLAAAEAEKKAEADRVQAETEAVAAAQAKKEAAAAKRREARLKRKEANGSGDSKSDSVPPKSEDFDCTSGTEGESKSAAPEPTKKRQRTKKEDKGKEPALHPGETLDSPPKWFTQFVTKMMEEKKEQEGSKTSKKELKEMGQKAAQTKWEDGYTRERIRNAVDGHLGQMYSMIFT